MVLRVSPCACPPAPGTENGAQPAGPRHGLASSGAAGPARLVYRLNGLDGPGGGHGRARRAGPGDLGELVKGGRVGARHERVRMSPNPGPPCDAAAPAAPRRRHPRRSCAQRYAPGAGEAAGMVRRRGG